MKRLFAADGRAVLVEMTEPTPGPGDVLVQPAFSVISSGTEMHIIEGTAHPDTFGRDTYPGPFLKQRPQLRHPSPRWDGPQPPLAPPGLAPLGYSLAGTVVAVGERVTDLQPSDRVACSGNQCAVHAEQVVVPRNLVAPLPDGVPLDQAAFVTLGAITIESLRRTGCMFGETVVIYGLGLLGLLAVQVARYAGYQVLGLDIDNRRVEQALVLGAHRALNPDREDPVAAVKAMTDGFGADAVLLAVVSESSEPLNIAFDLCRQKGRVVGLGLFGMTISRDRMYRRDVTFVPSIAYGPGRYDPVYEEGGVDYPIGYARWTEGRNMQMFLRLLAEGQMEVVSLAPTRVPFSEAPQAYEMLRRPDRPPTVILAY
ncbi:MAG: zinc-binding dehydrogenase [Anaerolineae bacterium]|nr:zinc-binding dehydrogenase [Anaerolineae bacterium]